MIVFPNAKINLGLAVTERRSDGYHNIETVFCPVGWSDVLEVIDQKPTLESSFNLSGSFVQDIKQENIVMKAYSLLKVKYKLPQIQIHLHKVVPTGAGLGGGSSDAVFILKLLNEKYSLNISQSEMLSLALELGSDCPFFVYNRPMLAKGRGEILAEINLELKGHKILIVNPGIHCSTKKAFEGIKPAHPAMSIEECVTKLPLDEWKNVLCNDFEAGIFKKYPRIKNLKKRLYNSGAVYASMSGSGSSVYGIFKSLPEFELQAGESSFSGNFL